MPNPASIRLGTVGKAQVKADFAEVAQAGTESFTRVGDEAERQAKRWSKAEASALKDIEAGQARLERAKAKMALFSGTGAANPMPANDQSSKAAEQSARIAAAAYDQLQRRADALVAAMNPAVAAQQRFNREIGEARGLVSAGVLSLDQYADKLRMEQQALDRVSAGHLKAGNSAGAQRAAMTNLSYQAQDTFTQLSMGANVFSVLAIQGGQAAGAFAGLENKAGSVARFMIGPWGLGITAAMLVLGPLVGKVLDFSNATDDAVDKLKKDAAQTEVTRIAKERFAKTAEGVAAAIREGTAATLKGIEADKSSAEQANINAKNNLAEEISIRRKTLAKLADARAAANEMLGDDPGIGAQIGRDLRVSDLERQLKTQGDLIKAAEVRVQETRIALAGEAATRMTDPLARIKKQYDDQAAAARNAARAAVKGGEEVSAALTKQLAAIERNRAAAVKAEQDKQKASHETARRDPDTVTSNQVAKLLRAELPGVKIGSTTRTPEHNRAVGGAPNSYHVRGNAIDFTPAGGMGAITKDDVRRIFTARGINVLELLGPGDKGHSDHFHVAWTKGKQSLDDFNDAAKRNKGAQDDLAKANRELDSDLSGLVRQFDPARAAADDYAESLAKIDALLGKGRLTPDAAAAFRLTAFAENETKQNELRMQGFNKLFDDVGDPIGDAIARNTEAENAKKALWNTEQVRRKQAEQEGVRSIAGLYRDLMSGGTRSIFDNFKQMGIDAIAQLAAKWTFSQIGKMGGGGGLLGGLFSAVGSLFGGKIGANATGTEYWGGGVSLVGELGPELVSMPKGARVTQAADTRRMLTASNDRAPAAFHFDLRGAVVTEDLLAQMNAMAVDAKISGANGGRELAAGDLQKQQSRALG